MMQRVAVLLVVSTLVALASAPPAAAHGLIVAGDGGRRTTPAAPRRAPIALALHRVEAKIDGPVADVTVEQTFRNTTNRRLEGTYLFPLPEGAAVAKFAMTMGGKMVEGEVMDAGKAREIYEGIVRRQRDPGLLEYVGRGLFRARVFPIEPHGDVKIRLAFQQVLPDNGGTLEFRYPLATDRLHGQPVEETVVTVDVTSDVPVKAVYSPSHDLATVRKDETTVHASFESRKARQARDFLLYVGRSPEDVGFTLLSHKPVATDGTFLAVLAPTTKPSDVVVPKDVIFVLDVSGSMAEDDKIGQARRALSFGLGVLRPEDRFGLVAFSTTATRFRDALVPATPENRKAARAWLEDKAAQGGTNLLQGVLDALLFTDAKRLPMIVLLSDGRPTVGVRDAKVILQRLERGNADRKARIFTFGVGHDLDVKLMDTIAEKSRGARDYVLPTEELEMATSRFFRKVVDPVLTDVSIDLGEGVHDVYPPTLPDLFSGTQVVVMGRFRTPGPQVVRLKGRIGQTEVEHVYHTHLAKAAKADYLPRLWAHRKIAFLLDEIRLHGPSTELVEEVKRLALKYAIVTPYTSGLVTDDAELERHPRHGRSTGGPDIQPPPRPTARRGGGYGGHGGRYRGPGDAVPPGLREPTDATPPAPPPPTGPPTTPAPVTPMTPGYTPSAPSTRPPAKPAPDTATNESKKLRKAKESATEKDEQGVRLAAGKTFLPKDGRWVDTGYEAWAETRKKAGKKMEPTKVEFLSDAWMDLQRKDAALRKILAVGERLLFVWNDRAYEVLPAADPK